MISQTPKIDWTFYDKPELLQIGVDHRYWTHHTAGYACTFKTPVHGLSLKQKTPVIMTEVFYTWIFICCN